MYHEPRAMSAWRQRWWAVAVGINVAIRMEMQQLLAAAVSAAVSAAAACRREVVVVMMGAVGAGVAASTRRCRRRANAVEHSSAGEKHVRGAPLVLMV